MVDYANTKIYYIKVNGKRYYGHSAEKYLSTRQRKHRQAYNNFKFTEKTRCKLMLALRDNNYRADQIVCVWVEDYPCKSIHEAKAREQYWIKRDGELNTYMPNRTPQEQGKLYREANKEKRKTQQKIWWEKNKDTVSKKKKEKYEEVKDELNEKRREAYNSSEDLKAKNIVQSKEWRQNNREAYRAYKKAYYQEHQDYIKAKRKEYYEANKEAINEKRRASKAK